MSEKGAIEYFIRDIINEEINKKVSQLGIQDTTKVTHVEGVEFLNNVTKAVERSGQQWTKEEDVLLRQEFRTAVAQIALNHKRSRNAIRERLLHDGLYSEV